MAFLRHILMFFTLFLFFNESSAIGTTKIIPKIDFELLSNNELDSILQNRKTKDSIKRSQLIMVNETLLSNKSKDSISVNKALAILYSKNQNAKKASKHIRAYIRSTQDLSILNDHVFAIIKNEAPYKNLVKEYKPHFNFLSIVYALTGVIAIFMVMILLAKKNLDRTSALLIGAFVFFHSVFMLHISLFVSNYNLKFPHTFYASTPFSFLYGPLLYFYFKRVIQNYKLSLRDSFHLIPTVLLVLWLIPCYTLSGTEKFRLMFDNEQSVLVSTKVLVVLKAFSLAIYAIGIYNIYIKNVQSGLPKDSKTKIRAIWERSIMTIFVCYAFAYILHGSVVLRLIEYEPFLYIKAFLMIAMIFYITVMSGLQPEIIMNANGSFNYKNRLGIKYEKSNLTSGLSNELKEELIKLMKQDKVYKKNSISLEMLSDMLDTTRHNTSQVINEHFGMSFYDLINYFRIMEAVEIFDEDKNRNLNIIDVAYEVGYNNKVTFNKAFKKQMCQTPSTYIKSLQFA